MFMARGAVGIVPFYALLALEHAVRNDDDDRREDAGYGKGDSGHRAFELAHLDALVVPTACEHAPMATPVAMRFFTWKIFAMRGEKMAPRMPVMMTAATVIDVIPPSSCEAAMAMGVVTDLGINESAISLPSPSTLHSV